MISKFFIVKKGIVTCAKLREIFNFVDLPERGALLREIIEARGRNADLVVDAVNLELAIATVLKLPPSDPAVLRLTKLAGVASANATRGGDPADAGAPAVGGAGAQPAD